MEAAFLTVRTQFKIMYNERVLLMRSWAMIGKLNKAKLKNLIAMLVKHFTLAQLSSSAATLDVYKRQLILTPELLNHYLAAFSINLATKLSRVLISSSSGDKLM